MFYVLYMSYVMGIVRDLSFSLNIVDMVGLVKRLHAVAKGASFCVGRVPESGKRRTEKPDMLGCSEPRRVSPSHKWDSGTRPTILRGADKWRIMNHRPSESAHRFCAYSQ